MLATAYVINTAIYCVDTMGQLIELVRRQIDNVLVDALTLDAEEEHFQVRRGGTRGLDHMWRHWTPCRHCCCCCCCRM